ncbi:hypothetical protein IHE31_00750 (plasmid) [Mycetohabitans rhizoxinica]|uniref:hypothetical protein n=1 Tax=Mycetohabitans rhizoxinica TaxID=412963 RepID=UPI0030D44A3F
MAGLTGASATGWVLSGGRGGMVCLAAYAARALFGTDLFKVHVRCNAAHGCAALHRHPFLDTLLEARDNAATLIVLLCSISCRGGRRCRGGLATIGASA